MHEGEQPAEPEISPGDESAVATVEPVTPAVHAPPVTFAGGSKTSSAIRPIIVVKRRKKSAHAGAHGGAWKIAYADFVTAMMAFFLLMWLLTSTNHGDLQGIADYFNRPLNSMFKEGPGTSATSAPETNSQKEAAKQKRDEEQLAALKTKIDAVIDKSPKLRAFKNQIKIDMTTEGLRIQIVDDKNRPMFDKGDASLKSYTRDILDQIGVTLNDVPNHISLAGHTDSLGYSGSKAGYSNWELSSERANAARRELLDGGMKDNKILQVRGLADAIPLIKNNTAAPSNRRISIVVLNHQTEANFLRDGGKEAVDVGESKPLTVPDSETTPAASESPAAP